MIHKYWNSPELAMTHERNKIINDIPMISDEIKDLLKPIVGQKGIEIAGGIGIVAEHLSATGNSVRLVEELSRFFVYRRQLFPNSKVIEMNVGPHLINSNKQHYDFAIIHSDEWLNTAKNIANIVYNVTTKVTHEKKSNEQIPVNNSEGSVDIPKDEVVTEIPATETTDTGINIPAG
jgi:16S rRNA A1518/A1519 N6-dimethyltransferase RsmA/KsgA/DIM1 with predicted DNA glycosylase/AP lyase activity